MTYVGKILVIVIMIFAISFLALSTMIFMTERDWKKEVDRLKAEQSKISGQLSEQKSLKEEVDKNFEAAKTAHSVQVKALEAQITNLENEVKTRQNEITQQRTANETALQNMRAAQQNAEAKDAETAKLREQTRAIQLEANNYKLDQLELKDRIRTLELQLEGANRNNKALRETNLALQGIIKDNGINPDPSLYTRRTRPLPLVDGEVLQADNQNKRFQISVGTDDGIDTGDELEAYRLKPKPEYLGKLRVEIADNDRAVATLIGTSVQGKKIQEGDIVSTKIRPRD